MGQQEATQSNPIGASGGYETVAMPTVTALDVL